MKKTLLLIAVIACALASTAIAATLPSYYPAEGFQRTGIVDAVYIKEGRIVIGDISYSISESTVVHSLSSYSDSFSRIRQGARVAFKLNSNRVIAEFWLLPRNYDASKPR
jgi:opacity protein-like surface antigen